MAEWKLGTLGTFGEVEYMERAVAGSSQVFNAEDGTEDEWVEGQVTLRAHANYCGVPEDPASLDSFLRLSAQAIQADGTVVPVHLVFDHDQLASLIRDLQAAQAYMTPRWAR